jgi:hypothetical protein
MIRLAIIFLFLTLSACETVRDIAVELDRVEQRDK